MKDAEGVIVLIDNQIRRALKNLKRSGKIGRARNTSLITLDGRIGSRSISKVRFAVVRGCPVLYGIFPSGGSTMMLLQAAIPFPRDGLRYSHRRCRAPARCRENPASCRPTSGLERRTSVCCVPLIGPAARSAKKPARTSNAGRQRCSRKPSRRQANVHFTLAFSTIFFGVVLQASLAFETTVFKNLLLGGHSFQGESHLDRFDENRRVGDRRLIQNGVGIDQREPFEDVFVLSMKFSGHIQPGLVH